MSTTLRTASCQACTWRASGTTSWTAADAHATETGHTVRRSGGDPNARPKPFTQPLEGDGA